ncbi:MAG: hypothetical protein IPI78_14820 [Chitinophagaceae bacterium]|nr:hypothetical protein [Chitinophagaceae bacterium]
MVRRWTSTEWTKGGGGSELVLLSTGEFCRLHHSSILAAYTLAPLDDNGGHINTHVGYHYHAATGKTKR